MVVVPGARTAAKITFSVAVSPDSYITTCAAASLRVTTSYHLVFEIMRMPNFSRLCAWGNIERLPSLHPPDLYNLYERSLAQSAPNNNNEIRSFRHACRSMDSSVSGFDVSRTTIFSVSHA